MLKKNDDNPASWLPGVLSKKQLKVLCSEDVIAHAGDDKSFDYSSIDLHLSEDGREMINGSIKPCGRNYNRYIDNQDLARDLPKDNSGAFSLDRGKCYVFKLKEVLTPNAMKDKQLFGQATAKSTIGRLDIIARLIIDGTNEYDKFNPNDFSSDSRGDIYLEIVPISFPIKVRAGASLSQLRIFKGDPNSSIITDENFIKAILLDAEDKEGKRGKGFLSVDLTNTNMRKGFDCAAFWAAKNIHPIDITKKKKGDVRPDPCEYWRYTSTKPDDENRLKIEIGKFYILRSKERICLPSGVAVYARAMDETLGEMRIHYAGFVHPFFGKYRKDGRLGTPLIFEVRGHNIAVFLNHKERLAKLNFYRMSEVAEFEEEEEDEEYNNQELQLSKCFATWPENCSLLEDGTIINLDKKGGE